MSKEKATYRLIGPFAQILTMVGMSLRGTLKDEDLQIITGGGILVKDGFIERIGSYAEMLNDADRKDWEMNRIEEPMVALPGFVDAHTHICFAGDRAADYAARNNGKTYLEIAGEGGGIWSTVQKTRDATMDQLKEGVVNRASRALKNGVTTIEVKSGYGLSTEHELKMLRAIQSADSECAVDLVPTCLAAHMNPKDFGGNGKQYLSYILNDLVPVIRHEDLCRRFDIFIEESAFQPEEAKWYLSELKTKGYDLTVHGDQFTVGGSKVAVECGARSVDHLEASGDDEIDILSKSNVIPVALPGASIGLGCNFTPARKLLDAGCSLAIASDWNPGSAPQGQLLTQAAILGAYEKLSAAEVFAAMTFRAATTLGLSDRGILKKGCIADIASFPCEDYRQILYHQGSIIAGKVWKKGKEV